jgi:peptidoglycan hydrolase-like protein with peptidoglycan-binding domain
MPGRPTEDLTIFTDEDLIWVDQPSRPTQPASRPAPPRPRRPRPRRTARSDAAALVRALSAIPLWALVLLVLGLAAGVTALALRDEGLPGTGSDPAPQPTLPAAGGAADPAVAADARALQFGDQGAPVRGLQAALNLLGFGPEAADGFYSEATVSAVASFQSSHGIEADGVAGPVTSAALTAALTARAREYATTAGQGLTEALAAKRVTAKDGARYQEIIVDALARLERLSATRGAYVVVALREVAGHVDTYEGPRALALFTTIEATARHLEAHRLAEPQEDITGEDGTVYRFSRAHGFQFHPIANFARLNKLVSKEKKGDAARLSSALVERAVPVGNALTWEYYFPFGGPTRWTSGFAQAVAAQAFARAADLTGRQALLSTARAAHLAIPASLSLEIGGGRWVREYGFNDSPILNAQLQSLVSLRNYVDLTGDEDAARTVSELDTASRNLLTRFDTGCWSLYALGGSPASVDYHTYHVSLLGQLTRITGAPVYEQTAARWEGFLRQSPSGCSA